MAFTKFLLYQILQVFAEFYTDTHKLPSNVLENTKNIFKILRFFCIVNVWMLNCYQKQQIFQKCSKTLTNTMWHSELFYSMFEETKSRNAVLQKELTEPLKDYLGFRHVFRHSYGYELDWLRLNPLFFRNGWCVAKSKRNLEKFLLVMWYFTSASEQNNLYYVLLLHHVRISFHKK